MKMNLCAILSTLLQIAFLFVEGNETVFQTTTFNITCGPNNAIDGDNTTASITKNSTEQYWRYDLPQPLRNKGYQLMKISVLLKGVGQYRIFLKHTASDDICTNKTYNLDKQHMWEVDYYREVHCLREVESVQINKTGYGQLIIYEVTLYLCTENGVQCVACQITCSNISNSSFKYPNSMEPSVRKDDGFGICCNGNHSFCENGKRYPGNGTCIGCLKGKHGNCCDKDCPQFCLDDECQRVSGKCISCLAGYHGDMCDKQSNTSLVITSFCGSQKNTPIYLSCHGTCNDTTDKNIQSNKNLTDCLISCIEMYRKTKNKTSNTGKYTCSDCTFGKSNINYTMYIDGLFPESCINVTVCIDHEDFGNIKNCWKGSEFVITDDQGMAGKGIWILTISIASFILLLGIIIIIGLMKSGYLRRRLATVLHPVEPIQVFSRLMKTEENTNDSVIIQTTGRSSSNAETGCAENTITETATLSESNMYINYSTLYNKISVDQFIEIVKKMKESGKIRQEYKELPDGLLEEHSDALKPLNRRLNRYRNIYPYNTNRVVLQVDTYSSESDFINASYVHGYNFKNRYVAAQGPFTDQTVSDFWRMIWQLDCNTIVMLTNVIENGVTKCLRYWPDDEPKTHGKIQLKLEESLTLKAFTKRNIEMSVDGEKKVVTQFHFTAWPDKGIPKSKSSLLEFRKAVCQHPINEMPIVVHCSAGIGRTGTFMSLDYLLNEAENEGSIDVIKCICRMRRQRTNVIQSWEQYMFLYETIAESLQDTQHITS